MESAIKWKIGIPTGKVNTSSQQRMGVGVYISNLKMYVMWVFSNNLSLLGIR